MNQVSYAQTDPRWSKKQLGFEPGDIGTYGCLLTAFCNIAANHGHNVNPAQLNDIFAQRGIDAGWLDGRQLSVIYPDIVYQGYKDFSQSSSIDVALFDIGNKPNVEMIVKLDWSGAQGLQTHFCRVWGVDNGRVMIVDSYDGKVKYVDAAYGRPQGDVIYGVDIYQVGTPPPPAPQPAPVATVTIPKAEYDELKGWKQHAAELKSNVDLLTGTVESLQATIKELSERPTKDEMAKALTSVQEQLDQAKADYEAEKAKLPVTVVTEVPLTWRTVLPWIWQQLRPGKRN